MDDKAKIAELKRIIMEEARERRESAGYNGSMSDNGAGLLEMQVKFYEHGETGAMPPEWLPYEKHLDPDYQTYLRLQRRYENH